MKDLLLDLFGEYEPIILDGIGYALDVPYIMGVLIFALLMYCVLRILGGFLNAR